ncbi:MAG: hypothetical protein HYX32_05190 [Actinobacteria bacterium]|nr:hypothetical protein [Actinomycetota bacterium]
MEGTGKIDTGAAATKTRQALAELAIALHWLDGAEQVDRGLATKHLIAAQRALSAAAEALGVSE